MQRAVSVGTLGSVLYSGAMAYGAGAKRRPFASPETGEEGSRRSVSIAPIPGEDRSGTRDRLPPARGSMSTLREGSKPEGRDAKRLGLQEPARPAGHAKTI
jgi:hypothetical protein